MTRSGRIRKYLKISNGFTLIELLVVISIISLLIAILLPALARARAIAKQAKCLSGVRQVNLAAVVYQNENRDFYPHGDASTQSYATTMINQDLLPENVFTNAGGCPYGPGEYSTAVGDPIRAGATTSVVTTYGINGILQAGYGKPDAGPPYTPIGTSWALYGPQTTNLGRIRKSSSKVGVAICSPVTWDSDNSRAGLWHALYYSVGYSQNGTWDIPDPDAIRHEGDGLSFAAADGHTEFVPTEVIVNNSVTFAVGAAPFSLSTYTPETIMDYSFRYLYRTTGDIDY